jgi:hypothetical protein
VSKDTPITLADLERLTRTLGDEQLATAMRLIAHQARSATGVAVQTAHLHLGIGLRRWKRLSADLEALFDISGGFWSYPPLAERLRERAERRDRRKKASCRGWVTRKAAAAKQPEDKTGVQQGLAAGTADKASTAVAETAPAQRPVTTGENSVGPADASYSQVWRGRRGGQKDPTPTLFPMLDLAPPSVSVAKAQSQDTEQKSILGAIYSVGVDLLMNSGKSESAARSCLARLLKEYDAGFVATAVHEANQKRDQIAEPYSWIRGILKKYPTKAQERDASRSRHSTRRMPIAEPSQHPLATPDFLGLSESMVRKIRDSNSQARKFEYVDDATDTNPIGG